MRSMKIQVFLSCSFDESDKNVVGFFHGICKGVDIQCVNVDKGFIVTPPDKARELICNSHALVAIVTKRNEKEPGVFGFPEAVDEEISMAYAQNRPILLFVEKGVDTSAGFVRNFTTYQTFERDDLYNPAFIEKAIASIHEMKVAVISPHELQCEQQGQDHVFAETNRLLIELIDIGGSYIWKYSTTRNLQFTARFLDPIKAAAWATAPFKDAPTSERIKWNFVVHRGSKSFKMKPEIEKDTPDHCEIRFELEPKPEANDFIEYSTEFVSPYLNPVYLEDVKEDHPFVIINENKYICYDGVVPIIRTKDLKVQIRMAASLGLSVKDLAPFVGCYTNKVDYLVESEMKRVTIAADSYGGNIFYELSVQSPLLSHVYGVAWNPLSRKK